MNILRNAAIGGIAAIAEVMIDHPLFTIKNMYQSKQQDHPFKNGIYEGIKTQGLFGSAQYIYTGVVSNTVQMIPVTAIQVSVTHAIKEFVTPMVTHIGVAQVLGATAGGMVSSLVSGPTEFIIKQQQRNKDEINLLIEIGKASKEDLNKVTFFQTAQDLISENGIGVLTTGMFGIACRDGIFTCGYMALMPLAQAALIYVGFSAMIATGVSTITMGVLVSLLSQPFDLVATRQQQIDQSFNPVLGFFESAKQIYVEEGFARYFQGGLARSLRVISGSFIIGTVEHNLQQRLP